MKLRLLADRILVKLDKPKQERDLGNGVVLHYPTDSHGDEAEINVWGEVLDVGPGKWARRGSVETGERIPMEVKPGDRVMVVWYLTKVETNRAHQALLGEDTIIIKPEDIICVDPQ